MSLTPPRRSSPETVRRQRWAVLATLLLIVTCGCATVPGPDPEPLTDPQQPEFEAIARRLAASSNRYLGRAQISEYRNRLADGDLAPTQRVEALKDLAWHQLRVGEVELAVKRIEEAWALTEQEGLGDDTRAAVLFMRGVVYLRESEVQNCILRHNRDCCILPLAGGGVHARPEPARRARAGFEGYLELRPGDARAIWLLNIIAMAVGDYPDGVPARYRVPPASFESEGSFPRFIDVAPKLGVDTFNSCGGAAAEDFDGDGLIDVVTSTFDPTGPLAYYRNRGDGTFEDLSSDSWLNDQLGGLNLVAADYDNDGDIDLFVLRGAWLFDDGRIRNSLLRNNGDGTFTDVTRAAGVAEPQQPTQTAAWGDYDNDGDLDLYVPAESRDDDPERYPSQLFRNDGDGTFTDVAAEAGVLNHRFGKGVTAGDYDNDGDLDLYVSNLGPNRLYRNEGDLRFTDVAPALGVEQPSGRSFATWFFDYDNDGWLDLFVAGYDTTLASVYRDALGGPHGATPPHLYRNNGDGTFTEIAKDVGLDHAYLPMGANFGDVDGDGWLDVYLSTGDPGYVTLMRNVLLRNDRGRRFQDVTTAAGVGHLQKGHGVAFADFDNDGDQDLYHQLGGFYPGDAFQNALFVNPGGSTRSLTIRLVGTTSNAAGYGARIRVVLRTNDGRRELHRAVGSVSSFGGSPLRQEIGLGDATAIETLDVYWPTSGLRQTFDEVPPGSAIRIVEGEDGYEVLELPRADLLEAAARNHE